jgi:hypothetical protein
MKDTIMRDIMSMRMVYGVITLERRLNMSPPKPVETPPPEEEWTIDELHDEIERLRKELKRVRTDVAAALSPPKK